MRITGLRFWWHRFYYLKLRPLFKDENKRVRKSIPRTFEETDVLFRDIAFSLIVDFYENQYTQGMIDWQYAEELKATEQWLIASYQYLTKDRNNAYDILERYEETIDENDANFREKYQHVVDFEETLDAIDDLILYGFVTHRRSLWT